MKPQSAQRPTGTPETGFSVSWKLHGFSTRATYFGRIIVSEQRATAHHQTDTIMTTQLSPELNAAALQQAQVLVNAGASRSTAEMLVLARMMELLVELAKENNLTVAQGNEMQASLLRAVTGNA